MKYESLIRVQRPKRAGLTLVALVIAIVYTVSCRKSYSDLRDQKTAGPASQITTNTYHGAGVVEAIDGDRRTIKINHGDIKGYMEAMSMDFHVRDKSLLDQVKVGDPVNFTLEERANIVVITDISKR